VPVFVVGTKKDKLMAFREMALLEKFMQKTHNFDESRRLARREANRLALKQFAKLREELAQIKWYKADGYVCLSQSMRFLCSPSLQFRRYWHLTPCDADVKTHMSKTKLTYVSADDESGIQSLLTQTLEMITDERVRLFCVGAQVVNVEQKIDSAITECMRLGTHAIRTAMVPLPLTGMASTPTISRIICEHILICFGFPKAVPSEVDEVMTRIVLGNLKKYLALTLAQFLVLAAASSGLALATVGAGAVAWLAAPFLNAPPTARMVLKCSAEMILILERSFRYGGKYVTVKQIEDAAMQYVSMSTTGFDGQPEKFQQHVRDEIDRLVPLKKIVVGLRFNSLRSSFEHIIYKHRFDKPPEYEEHDPLADRMAELEATLTTLSEAPGDYDNRAELAGDSQLPVELDSTPVTAVAELPGSDVTSPSSTLVADEFSEASSASAFSSITPVDLEESVAGLKSVGSQSTVTSRSESIKSKSSKSGSSLLSRMHKSLKITRSGTGA
jgi:hypothetical protein